MEEADLERLLRESSQTFDQLVILDWYDGVLSGVALLEEEEVALLLEAVWADGSFPKAESYLYQVSTLPYTAVTRLLLEVDSRLLTKQAQALEELLPAAQLQNLLLQLDGGNNIISVWRRVDPGTP